MLLPEEYERRIKAIDSSISFNIQTAIGERFNAGISQRIDVIKNNQICDVNTGEPLLKFLEGVRSTGEIMAHQSMIKKEKKQRLEVVKKYRIHY